ncbi:MAG: hypothetical protein FWD69_06165 [Polyangiaceae bacterium]|nr:hypothetical protein [Polyangiaceae bacterium]
MTTKDPLQSLSEHRTQLLTCEAIGWLHMAGKAHPDFVRTQVVSSEAADLYNQFDDIPPIGDHPIVPKDLFEKYDKKQGGDSNLLGLLQAAHAMASGIEKNTPGEYQKQSEKQTWLTTAFGHPVRNLLEDRPPVLADGAWTHLYGLINNLVASSKENDSVEKWQAWRREAIGPEGWLRNAFTSTLAETRVPNNDVTLWDQSYIAAALFKSAVAGAILTGTSFEWGDNIKSNTRWRVLTVGFGAEHYENRAVRIGDWTGACEEIAKFFNEVCEFIEVELALGACVYRDERVLSFTFPGQRLDSTKDSKENVEEEAVVETLRKSVEEKVDGFAHEYSFETPPFVKLSTSTRSFIVMARELACARRKLEVPIHRPWSIEPDGSSGSHVCPVSLVRMGHPSNEQADKKQDVSKICFERRTGRRKNWEKSGGDTIWISEIADDNDRVALLTFSFGLESWLDGKYVDSLRAHDLVEWQKEEEDHQKKLAAPAGANLFRAFCAHIEDFVQDPKRDDKGKLKNCILELLNKGFNHETCLEKFFQKVVEDRAESPKWSDLDDSRRAEWLAHQLLRKNASPGRVHRFWRTTQNFFDSALDEFRRIVVLSENPNRTRRLKLTLLDVAACNPVKCMPDIWISRRMNHSKYFIVERTS